MGCIQLQSSETPKTVAIAQPTFLPWAGWFDLADRVDLLVLLDDVAFSKQSWQQRNRIRTPKGLEFLSVPVKTSGRFGQEIRECELANTVFVNKMIRSLNANYAQAPFFPGAIHELAETMMAATKNHLLAELNSALISWMAARLGVTTTMMRASGLGVGGDRGEHVARICERVGALHYLSPPGSEDYLVLDKAAFEQRGISVQIQMYEHPEYVQSFAPFVPYASALDLIFNVGPQAGDVMRSGRRPARALRENLN